MSDCDNNDESDYLDERSTDGSDNGSDLEDFIVEDNSDEEEDEEEVRLAEPKGIEDEVAELKQDNVELVQSSTVVNGVRRSTRKRKATSRYEEEVLMQDKEYLKLQKLMHKGIEDLDESTDEEELQQEDDDEDFEQSSKSDSDSDSEEDDEEEEEEAPILAKKVTFADQSTTVGTKQTTK